MEQEKAAKAERVLKRPRAIRLRIFRLTAEPAQIATKAVLREAKATDQDPRARATVVRAQVMNREKARATVKARAQAVNGMTPTPSSTVRPTTESGSSFITRMHLKFSKRTVRFLPSFASSSRHITIVFKIINIK